MLVPLDGVACVGGYALVARGAPRDALTTAGAPRRATCSRCSRDRRLLLLLGPAALHWAACAPYHLFFGVLVRDLGLPADVTGAGMAIGVVAEIVALLFFPRLERRFPLRALLAVAFLGSALRWAILSRVTGPAAVAGLQALHGLTFGLFWGSAMRRSPTLVPPRLRATGQAVFTGVVFGGANAIGYALSGVGYDRFGGAGPLFAWAAGARARGARRAPRSPAPAVARGARRS